MPYFASTIAWYRYGQKRKAVVFDRLLGRARIEWQQVLAQLGWGCVLAVIAWLGRPSINLTSAFVGVVAVAAGEIWATEIGVLSRTKPRRTSDGQQVAAGTSGALSLLGLVSAVGGA